MLTDLTLTVTTQKKLRIVKEHGRNIVESVLCCLRSSNAGPRPSSSALSNMLTLLPPVCANCSMKLCPTLGTPYPSLWFEVLDAGNGGAGNEAPPPPPPPPK